MLTSTARHVQSLQHVILSVSMLRITRPNENALGHFTHLFKHILFQHEPTPINSDSKTYLPRSNRNLSSRLLLTSPLTPSTSLLACSSSRSNSCRRCCSPGNRASSSALRLSYGMRPLPPWNCACQAGLALSASQRASWEAMVGSWVQSSRRWTSGGGDFGVSFRVRDVNWSLGVGVCFQGQVVIETHRGF